MISAAVQVTIVAGIIVMIVRAGERLSPTTRQRLAAIAIVKFLLPATFLGGGLFALAAASNTTASLMEMSWPIAIGIHVAGSATVLGCLLADVAGRRRLLRASAPVAEGPLHERCGFVARRMGLTSMPRIWMSAHASAPLAFGLFRRQVVLPTSLAEQGGDDLDIVVAHEMAHHARGDLWMLSLHRAVIAIWWWHPLAWRLGVVVREAIEDGADDRVLASGLASRERYCDVLVDCARAFAAAGPTALGFADRCHPVARRVLRLGAGDPIPESWWPLAATALLAAALLPGIPEPPAPDVRTVIVQRIIRVNQ